MKGYLAEKNEEISFCLMISYVEEFSSLCLCLLQFFCIRSPTATDHTPAGNFAQARMPTPGLPAFPSTGQGGSLAVSSPLCPGTRAPGHLSPHSLFYPGTHLFLPPFIHMLICSRIIH